MNKTTISFDQLRVSLYYLHVSELKSYCETLNLSLRGKKRDFIFRILHFLKTGEKREVSHYPEISIAKKKQKYSIRPEALMLKGAYKNDLKTRIFFRSLIGNKFHFTAFGIDWLEDRWLKGKPPTYLEFAEMWRKEYDLRNRNGAQPKQEWAYIRFVQEYILRNPKVDRNKILEAWETERSRHKNRVSAYLLQTSQVNKR